MLKLKLDNITKTYKGIEDVTALKGVSLEFRESEFVSILGPSGCGKTTLLNVIGGLDQYQSGDLIIKGMSTKMFKSEDWDAYRNRTIGFVFQNYNLIGHQNVLQNVEIAMTFSGVSSDERKERAMKALKDVGIADQAKKKPNQLSGGQMQRVAIARALVNNPDVILADEPTGALDTQTSTQIMNILKEIAKTRLVIMVTHNRELAEEYSSRIISLLDGEIQSDTNPITEEDHIEETPVLKGRLKRTSMSLMTAASLSFKNLLTKRGRTITTSFAGSIGIIGVALVLALSNGLSEYIDRTQSDTLAGFPITITTNEQISRGGPPDFVDVGEDTILEEFPNDNIIVPYVEEAVLSTHKNVITQEYLEYIDALPVALPDAVNNVSYTHEVNINLLAKAENTTVRFDTISAFGPMEFGQIGVGAAYWQELPESDDFVLSIYDLIGEGSRMPTSKNEVVLVVDEYNRINKDFFEKIGITGNLENYKLTDFIDDTFLKVIPNDDYYTQNNGLYVAASPTDYENLYNSEVGESLTVVGILRPKEEASSSYLSPGIAYTTALTASVLENAQNSEIAVAQRGEDKNLLLGTPFSDEEAKNNLLITLGAMTIPTGIDIYPKDFNSKDDIKEYLDEYNREKEETDQLIYSDMAEAITSITGTLLNTVTLVLVGFAAISLIVSTIMISIITYVSVIERTKEIGILRSVGARKKDISRVFNAETLIIGLSSGILGVGLSYLLTIPINAVILNLAEISGIAMLTPIHAILLVLGSMVLTFIAGFIPAKSAAKKDPVTALRTE